MVRAIEGEVFEGVCGRYEGGKKDCHHQGDCAISPVWYRLGLLIEEYFDGITLAALLEEKPGTCGKIASMLENIPSTRI